MRWGSYAPPMIIRFHHDERGYSAWLDEHPRGFVFNRFGGRDPAMNVLHRASCTFLRRDADAGARTVYEKACGETRDEVEAAATELRGGEDGWKHCGVCMR